MSGCFGSVRPASARAVAALFLALAALLPGVARAIPLFARQTGQNCVACHEGGQFPELTQYGRLFKMTGYTLGERTVPLAAMVTASLSKVANTSKSEDPSADFQKNKDVIFATSSLFTGGKITDKLGAFVQVTYDNYASQSDDGTFHGHSNADNMDFRYADRFVDTNQDLIFGVSFNNNPSLSDPWNTAPAWMQYVPVPSPTSSQFIDGTTPYPSYSAGGNIAGITAYGYWNQTIYAEFGGYGTSRHATGFMSEGIAAADKTALSGFNPYWRLAWTRQWGASNLMIGTAGMVARIYDDPLNTGDANTIHKATDWNIDAQYQYMLNPHSVTAQFVYAGNKTQNSAATSNQPAPNGFVDANGQPLPNTNAVNRSTLLRAKLTYVYQAKYGGSFALFDLKGTTDSANQSTGFDPATMTITSSGGAPSVPVNGNLSGNPATSGLTLEAFWTPIQYVRIGLQYTAYNKYNGASHNYDGFGRNAKDNNSLFLYLWGAY